MISRSRIPAVFNIYMLDVICCALGCVILLWQLKHDEAEQQTEAARIAEDNWKRASSEVSSVTAEIETLRAALDASKKQRDLLGGDIATLQKALDVSKKQRNLLGVEITQTREDRDDAKRLVLLRQKEYDALRSAWLLSEAMLKSIRGDLDSLKDKQKLAALDLASKVKTNAELLLQITAAEKKTLELEKQANAGKLDAQEAARRLQEQLARLQSVELKNKDLEKQVADLRAGGKDTLAQLTLKELRIKMLEQDMDKSKKDLAAFGQQFEALKKQAQATVQAADDTKATIAALEKDRAVLLAKAKAIQAEAERRFAGIALTGQNVLFLVDMSGSMAAIDENTLDPDKWPLVCETVGQLMTSIKGLQHYQVLLFSDKVRYPLGAPASWLKYDPQETPKKTVAALKAIKPEGETNMHAVFAEAFRYREGLDTIYVLSDGLPNAGDVLPGGGVNMTEAERCAMLTKHLRKKLKEDWNRPINQKRVRINAIGFFYESPDVGAFLWALAREHDGSFVGMSK